MSERVRASERESESESESRDAISFPVMRGGGGPRGLARDDGHARGGRKPAVEFVGEEYVFQRKIRVSVKSVWRAPFKFRRSGESLN